MKTNELKSKSIKELTELLNELKTKMAKLSFELEASALKDTSQIKKAKKDIARILTAVRQSMSQTSKS
jgi:large subunit ribosomal protein L29